MTTSLTGLTGGLGSARGIAVVGTVCSVGGTCLALNLFRNEGCSVEVRMGGLRTGVWNWTTWIDGGVDVDEGGKEGGCKDK